MILIFEPHHDETRIDSEFVSENTALHGFSEDTWTHLTKQASLRVLKFSAVVAMKTNLKKNLVEELASGTRYSDIVAQIWSTENLHAIWLACIMKLMSRYHAGAQE